MLIFLLNILLHLLLPYTLVGKTVFSHDWASQMCVRPVHLVAHLCMAIIKSVVHHTDQYTSHIYTTLVELMYRKIW